MLNKNDPLIGAVQEVMKKNQAERDAVKLVNEKFGVTDRKALPREKQGEWDAAYKQVLSEGAVGAIMKGTVAGAKKVNDYVVGKTTPDRAEMNMQPPHPKPKADLSTKVTGGQGIQGYDKQSRSAGPTKINWATKKVQGDNPKVSMDETLHPNQQKLDVHEPEKDKLTSQDFKMLPAKKKSMEEETLDERVKENKVKKNKIIAKIGAKARKAGDPRHLNNLNGIPGGTGIRQDVGDKIRGRELTSGRERRPLEEADSDVTSPSSMGIKKPDYASGTPDYAKPKEQTVNRAAKTSLPAGTVKEAKVNPYAVGMAAVKKSTGDQPPMEKKNIMKAHKIAKKIIAKKKMNEGFNNHHDLSVTASDENQVVAEQLNLDLKTSGLAGQRSVVSRSGNRMNMSNAAAERLRSNMIKDTSYTGMKNNIRTRADYVRQGLAAGTGQKPARFNDQGVRRPVAPAARPTAAQTRPTGKAPASVNAATGSLTATDTQRRAGMSVTNVRDVAYGANPTAKKLGPASSTGGQGPSPVPTSAAVQPKISAAGMAANRQRLANAAQANRVGSGPMAPAPGTAQAAPVAKAPPPATPATAPAPKAKPTGTAPVAKKPATTAPAAPVRKSAPQDSSTPAQRMQFNRQIDKGNAAPGTAYKGLGVTTGKVTGTTVTQKPTLINRKLPGK